MRIRPLFAIIIWMSLFLFSCKTKTKNVESCGDDIADPAEACDGSDLKGATCAVLGYYQAGNPLTCLPGCEFDTTSCGPRCGDGGVDTAFGEQCDGVALANQTCESLGLYAGTLGCTEGCLFDTSGCGGACGDGIIATGIEDCDGEVPEGSTCTTAGYYQGELRCDDDCAYDTTSCAGRCGDAIIDDVFGETCDGDNLDGATCQSIGFYGGELACAADCTHDSSNCEGTCGDGIIQPGAGETCDGAEFGGQSCLTLSYYTGNLSCSTECLIDSSGCAEICGDGILQSVHGEECDLGELDGGVCRTVGHFFGTLSCDAGCHYDGGLCRDVDVWGTTLDESGAGVAIDVSGNVIYVGATAGAPDLQVNAGAHDAYIRKFSPAGVAEWTRLLGTTGIDAATGVAVDSTGNIYVCGATAGTMATQTSNGDLDFFLAKYASNGALLWVRQWGTATMDFATGVAVDSTGNAFVTGYTSASMNGQTYLGMTDAFLVKFSSIGNQMWTRQFGSNNYDRGYAVAVDSTGSVFVTGSTGGAMLGQTFLGGEDVFLTRYNTGGTHQWSRQYGSTNGEVGFAIALDSTDNIYIAGTTVGTLPGETSAGQADLILLKLNSTGVLQWNDQWGSGGVDTARGVDVTPSGVIVVTGDVYGTVDGQAHLGNDDLFLSWYTAAGVRSSTRMWGTVSNDSSTGVVASASGDVFITGTTQGNLGGQVNAGGADAFLLFAF